MQALTVFQLYCEQFFIN